MFKKLLAIKKFKGYIENNIGNRVVANIIEKFYIYCRFSIVSRSTISSKTIYQASDSRLVKSVLFLYTYSSKPNNSECI